ncbi:MAG TPA: DUF4349 domain-containing protein [Vicinamibacterales bacterium]
MNATEHPIDPEELTSYYDGELPPERASAVQSHVAICPACQALSRDLGRVSRNLAAWTIEPAPQTIAVNVRAKEPPVTPSFRPRWLTARVYTVSGLAAAGVVLLFAIVPLNMTRARQQPATASATNRSATMTSASRLEGRPAEIPRAAPPPSAAPARVGGLPQAARTGQPSQGQTQSPRVVRTASLQILAKDFDAARASLDRIVAEMGGFVGNLEIRGTVPNARLLTATLRFPSSRLDAALKSLRAVGTVVEESQGSDDVTEQALDLEARIANGRQTEKRLTDLLQKRTGDLSDVLAAEREIARVREEIERLDAQRQNLESRVSYASVSLRITEAEKANMNLGPVPLATRLWNAFVDGFETMFVSVVEISIVALRVAPALIFWTALIGVPLYWLTRRVRKPA